MGEKTANAHSSSIVQFLFLLILVSQHVDSGSVVKSLPGFEGPLPFELETGYVGVGEAEEVQLFYYFIKSEKNPEEDPLLVWLSGGPSCSSLSGFIYENGPLTFKVEEYNGSVPTLVSTTYAWTKVANIIYLDQPVGTGFSYARSPLAKKPSDTGQSEQVYEFVRKWLVDHPKFVSNPFYMGGDSYSGMVIPAIVQRISKGNEEGLKPLINLQGYVLGNPKTNANFDLNYRVPFAHGMGLISDELYESLQRSCRGNYINVDPSNQECLKFIQDYDKCISRVYEELILLPNCNLEKPPLFLSQSTQRRYLRRLQSSNSSALSPDCLHSYWISLSSYWANDENVRAALHVVKGSIGKWLRCRLGIPYDFDIKSSIPYHLYNSAKGYRSLIYSGDHDLSVNFLGTQAWIRLLNYSIVDEWRPWMVKDQVGGFTKTYANKMTFATVKGSGHTAEYKPFESSIMFKRWITGKLL